MFLTTVDGDCLDFIVCACKGRILLRILEPTSVRVFILCVHFLKEIFNVAVLSISSGLSVLYCFLTFQGDVYLCKMFYILWYKQCRL